MNPRDLQYRIEPFAQAIDLTSYAFRDLIGQREEWTPRTEAREVSAGAANVNPLDDVILVDCSASATTMTLETAVGCAGRQHTFIKKDSSSNLLTVAPNGSEQIHGAATTAINNQNGQLTVKSDGVGWRILSFVEASFYTPTLTNVANLDSSSADACQFMRLGPSCMVSGRAQVKPTSLAVSTKLGISLPVASDLSNVRQAAGTAACPAVAGQVAAIVGDITNNRAQMEWIAGDTSNQYMYFSFLYRVR